MQKITHYYKELEMFCKIMNLKFIQFKINFIKNIIMQQLFKGISNNYFISI